MLYVQVIVEEVLIELVHTESACSTTSILGIVAVVRGCGMYARCACYLVYLFPIIQTYSYSPTHAPQSILYRECRSVKHQQLLSRWLFNSQSIPYFPDTQKVEREHFDFVASKNIHTKLPKTLPTFIKATRRLPKPHPIKSKICERRGGSKRKRVQVDLLDRYAWSLPRKAGQPHSSPLQPTHLKDFLTKEKKYKTIPVKPCLEVANFPTVIRFKFYT